MAVQIITFRGYRMTAVFRDAILAAEHRAGFRFTITQGGFNKGGVLASAGTHDGDAADWSIRGLTRAQCATMIEALRWAGIFASLRTRTALWGVRAQGFSAPHVHGVPNGWGSPSAGAKAQAEAYRRGRDGLRANGPDAGGPGHVSTYRHRLTPMSVPPGLPSTGVSDLPTTPTTGGLTMSDINTILSRLDYMQAQLKAVAEGSYGRDALNARNRDVSTIVKAATDAQSRVLLDAFGKLGVSTVDLNALKSEVRKAVADAMDGATIEIKAAQ